MKFMPMAIEALWDELVAGKDPDAAVAMIASEYEVQPEALRRIFDKRYDKTPEEIHKLRITPPLKVRKTALDLVNAAKGIARHRMETHRFRLPDWQWAAAEYPFLILNHGRCVFAGYYEGDRHPLRFVVVDTMQAFRMRGVYADELKERLRKKYEGKTKLP